MSKTTKDAKDTKTAKPADKKSNLPPKPEYKYNVSNLADALGIEPASVRIALRKAGVEKAEGGVYGWNTKTDFEAVVNQLKPKKGKEEAPAKKKAA